MGSRSFKLAAHAAWESWLYEDQKRFADGEKHFLQIHFFCRELQLSMAGFVVGPLLRSHYGSVPLWRWEFWNTPGSNLTNLTTPWFLYSSGWEALEALRANNCNVVKAWSLGQKLCKGSRNWRLKLFSFFFMFGDLIWIYFPLRKAYWNFWNVVDWVSIILAFAILITWISQCMGQAGREVHGSAKWVSWWDHAFSVWKSRAPALTVLQLAVISTSVIVQLLQRMNYRWLCRSLTQ